MVVINKSTIITGILADNVQDHVICGLVLCLRQLIPLVTMEMDDVMLLPKLYSLLLRCCLHGNHNVVTSALEALVMLLGQPVTSLRVWLASSLDYMTPMNSIGCHHGNNESTDHVNDPGKLTQPFPSFTTGGDVTALVSPNRQVSTDGDMTAPVSSSKDDTQVSTDGDVTSPTPPTGDDVSSPVGGSGYGTQTVSELEDIDGDNAALIPQDISSPLSQVDEDMLRTVFSADGDVAAPLLPTGDDIMPPSSDDTSDSSSSSSSDTSTSPTPDMPSLVPPSGDDTLLAPCDDHFVMSLSAADVSVSVSLASAHPSSHAPMLSCDLPHLDENSLGGVSTTPSSTPLNVLLQLLGTRLLTKHVKVSVKAIAMQCVVAIATWNPQQLLVTIETVEGSPKLIDLLLPYLESDDPKLCGTCCEVLSYCIKGALTTTADHMIPVTLLVDHVIKVLLSKSATVLHNSIPSLKVSCVVSALSSCDPLLGIPANPG